jgi:hypothetical protein
MTFTADGDGSFCSAAELPEKGSVCHAVMVAIRLFCPANDEGGDPS